MSPADRPAPDLRAVLRELVGPEELVCLFDADGRHTAGAGNRFGGPLDPAALESNHVSDAFADAPVVAARLDALYEAALAGERRRRELPIGDRTYAVETAPVSPATDDPEHAGGIVRVRPAGGDGAADPADTRSKLHQLHDIASALETTTSAAEIFDLAVESAGRVLEFDACAVLEVEDGRIVPRAATTSELDVAPEPKGREDGLAGTTIRTGETHRVGDVRDDPDAAPTSDRFRSALSIPLGDDGVFQAVSTAVDRYDDRDEMLAELLISHVANALERVRAQAALTRERDRFAALFQNVPDAAIQYRIEEEPVVEAVNSAFVRLFGDDPDEAVGRAVSSVLVPEADDAASLFEAIAAGERVDREVRLETADGSEPFLLRSVPVADGERAGYLICTDIGELKRREGELIEKNERLDEFVGVVSHDLRNPLNVAAGRVEMAAAEREGEHLDAAARAHDRMATLIEDLLTLARAGPESMTTTGVDLARAVEECWRTVDTKDATLVADTELVVLADESSLRQLLENVVRNSVHHGGPGVTVRIDDLADGFSVEDDGPGIPPDEREDVFRTGYSTADDGTGFGLRIVERIAEAHGWSVAVTEGADGGARFEFTGVEVAR